jgi:hypothetical protein
MPRPLAQSSIVPELFMIAKNSSELMAVGSTGRIPHLRVALKRAALAKHS